MLQRFGGQAQILPGGEGWQDLLNRRSPCVEVSKLLFRVLSASLRNIRAAVA